MGRPASDLGDYVQWQQRLENYKASNLPVDDFCIQEGVSRATFYRWLKRLENGIPDSIVSGETDGDRIKILFWDRDGFCIWYKRLERGTFQLLTTTGDEEGIELDYAQMEKLLGGLDLRTRRRRKRYRRGA